MPQMKPMNWLNLMLYFLMLMLTTFINLNFFIMKKKKKNYTNINTTSYYTLKW